MIKFKSNTKDDKYLTLSFLDISMLAYDDELSLPVEVVKDARRIFYKRSELTIKNKHNKDKFNIRKDSTIGQYLINNFDQDYIINEDEYIYYVQIIEALKISIFENNEIFNQIIPMFRAQVQGSKEELRKNYDESVLDYILENDNFEEFLTKQDENYEESNSEFIIYENGEFSSKILTNHDKVLKK